MFFHLLWIFIPFSFVFGVFCFLISFVCSGLLFLFSFVFCWIILIFSFGFSRINFRVSFVFDDLFQFFPSFLVDLLIFYFSFWWILTFFLRILSNFYFLIFLCNSDIQICICMFIKVTYISFNLFLGEEGDKILSSWPSHQHF